MNPSRRLALIHAAEIARKRKQRVSHIDRKLTWATVEQLKSEIAQETRSFWPTPIILFALGIGAIGAAIAIGVSA